MVRQFSQVTGDVQLMVLRHFLLRICEVFKAKSMWKYLGKVEHFHRHLMNAYRALLGQQQHERSQAAIHDIRVLHESDHFIVIEKAPDVLMNSEDRNIKVTVERQLVVLYPELVNPNLAFRFYFVHRLDYSTSGILCIAKSRRAAGFLGKQLERRRCEKYYLALVRGYLSEPFMTIAEPVGEDSREDVGRRMAASSMPYCVRETCKPAKTLVALLETGLYDGHPASKVLLRPITGRRHQLRVHCHIIGHTIVGDFTYSDRTDTSPHRMFLHAYKLIIENELGPLNVTTEDPFNENLPAMRLWKPDKAVKRIEEGLQELSNKL